MHLLATEATSFLSTLSFWEENESIRSIESAGAGNMNVVLRVQTNLRSVIAKQSFPFVRKFPQIPAPEERIESEYQFLTLSNESTDLSNFTPKVLAYYPEHHLMFLEDFGQGTDYSFLYSRDKKITTDEFKTLIVFLEKLHSLHVDHFPDNLKMKKLNHEHIFHFPFQSDNGFDLDNVLLGLQEVSLAYKNDLQLKEVITSLGEQYLKVGNHLLHGDFYPGSWLKVGNDLKVIDPEFGFLGNKEFDLGVFFAHLVFSGMDQKDIIGRMDEYKLLYSKKLAWQYAGIEIMRRIIGIAQLPLEFTLDERVQLLEDARAFILINE